MVVIYLNWFTPAIASAILETSAQFSIVPNTFSQGKKKCSEEKQILLMIFKKGKEQQKNSIKMNQYFGVFFHSVDLNY